MSTAVDEGCAPDISLRTTPLTGRITYETKGPNASFSDWGAAVQVPAPGFLVVVTRPDAAGTPQFIDAQITTERTEGDDTSGGRFSVRVPAVMTSEDRLFVLAVGVDDARRLVYVVGDPMLAPSTATRDVTMIPNEARIWSWNAVLNTLVEGDTILIRVSNGSGAARVFDYTRYVYSVAAAHYRPSVPQTLVAWVGLDTYWSCGSCFASLPTTRWANPFRHQLWMRGGQARDEGYWSDAVIAHELGHYVMSAFGRSPNEGGPHTLSVPTNPGQAWSEGWATFFSSRVRGDTRYYDKQDGGFFSLDVGTRSYESSVWQRPIARNGLFQLMDENEVSAMLWSLSRDVTAGEIAPFLSALSSTQMTASPFARGYMRRTWPSANPVDPTNYTSSADPAPMVGDMFDALLCGRAVSAAALDRVTEPSTRYPFPSDRPLCREGQSPIRAVLHGPDAVNAFSTIELSVEIPRNALSALEVEVSISLPNGVQLLRGPAQQVLPPEAAPTTSRRAWTLRFDQIPQDDLVVLVRAQGDGFSFHAPLRYRFGRQAASPPPPVFDTQRMQLHGVDIGRAIRVLPQRMQ